MHKTAYLKSPLTIVTATIILLLPLLIIIATPVAFAEIKSTEHGGGSKCYICHAAGYGGGGGNDSEAPHNITTADGVWAQCTDCHQSYNDSLEASVHGVMDCRGCHAPLHVSWNDPGEAGWLFVNRIDRGTTYNKSWYKPTLPLNWSRTIILIDSNNETDVGLTAGDLANMGGEVHWSWTNASGNPGGIDSTARYRVCLNCHFLTTNPAEAGLIRMVEGRMLIAVPEFSLQLAPHEITDSVLKEASTETGQLVIFKSDEVRTLSGIIAGIGIIGLVLWRKRESI